VWILTATGAGLPLNPHVLKSTRPSESPAPTPIPSSDSPAPVDPPPLCRSFRRSFRVDQSPPSHAARTSLTRTSGTVPSGVKTEPRTVREQQRRGRRPGGRATKSQPPALPRRDDGGFQWLRHVARLDMPLPCGPPPPPPTRSGRLNGFPGR
jgi:hypothetical protein